MPIRSIDSLQRTLRAFVERHLGNAWPDDESNIRVGMVEDSGDGDGAFCEIKIVGMRGYDFKIRIVDTEAHPPLGLVDLTGDCDHVHGPIEEETFTKMAREINRVLAQPIQQTTGA
jgi:hypothetical protein